MTTMTLEPCPFCGSPAIENQFGLGVTSIRCSGDCNASMSHRHPAEAETAWNRRAHLAQPAQAVDVVALMEHLPDNRAATRAELIRALALTRALSGEKAGPVGNGFVDRVLRVAAHMRMADWLGADGTLSDYDRLQALLPASPTPGKEGA